MMDADLLRKRLKELFDYDPTTGLFTRRVSRGNARAGSVPQPNHADGYVTICIDGRTYLGHRLAWLYMTGEWPVPGADHRNGEPADNRFRNLRPATQAQNTHNSKGHADSKSGVKGVRWHVRARKWAAAIYVDGRAIHLGLFLDVASAASAYAGAAREHYGEFARTE